MKTFSAKPGQIEQGWYVVDLAGQHVGRAAATVASILRGKHRPIYTPHVDTGEFVIVINADKLVLTGKKLEKKVYRWHTGWIGHLKEVGYDKLMKENPEKAMTIAVNGMLPNSTLGRKALTRLRCYAGAEHNNAAQKPVEYKF